MQSLNNKALALALVLGLSTASAQAWSCEPACKWYKGQWTTLFCGKDADDKEVTGVCARLKGSVVGVLGTAVVAGAVGYLVYTKFIAKKDAPKTK